ncbi:hypothetical protein P170DRAFT_80549 [Aspergillus steynii IBT 23096]|uniref:Uncharacterized protein n=1 Tax=Aspergillus steynii IBT 23096 TaxID=1392250 RepID=A0A2I2GF57_9EURO|nr:uncharacterized protein P170DRAFT_80549 [Aspergillus steynii IBT 23096]PLB51518.1 hypothetical protein P170DRAFT_80549 [Aspergillus steynii IBT 23096]
MKDKGKALKRVRVEYSINEHPDQKNVKKPQVKQSENKIRNAKPSVKNQNHIQRKLSKSDLGETSVQHKK